MTAKESADQRVCPAPFDDHAGEDVLFCRTVTFLLERRAGRRGCRGCARAWERFYDEYHPMVRRIVAHRSLERATHEDCVQEVWTEIVAKLPGLRYDPDRGSLQVWLGTIAWRKVKDYLRARSRAFRGHLFHDIDLISASSDWDPASIVQTRDEWAQLEGLIGRLRLDVSELTHDVLCHRLLEGRSVSETAERLGLTAQQVWAREHRAKKRLRELAQGLAGQADD